MTVTTVRVWELAKAAGTTSKTARWMLLGAGYSPLSASSPLEVSVIEREALVAYIGSHEHAAYRTEHYGSHDECFANDLHMGIVGYVQLAGDAEMAECRCGERMVRSSGEGLRGWRWPRDERVKDERLTEEACKVRELGERLVERIENCEIEGKVPVHNPWATGNLPATAPVEEEEIPYW